MSCRLLQRATSRSLRPPLYTHLRPPLHPPLRPSLHQHPSPPLLPQNCKPFIPPAPPPLPQYEDIPAWSLTGGHIPLFQTPGRGFSAMSSSNATSSSFSSLPRTRRVASASSLNTRRFSARNGEDLRHFAVFKGKRGVVECNELFLLRAGESAATISESLTQNPGVAESIFQAVSRPDPFSIEEPVLVDVPSETPLLAQKMTAKASKSSGLSAGNVIEVNGMRVFLVGQEPLP
eukprot:24349-Hanusia_phi.AAC.1